MHKDDGVTPEELELSAAHVEQDPSTLFADQAYLSYCVPAETDIKLETALERIEQGKTSIESIPQRDFLFFDETVDVLLILKSPRLEDHILRSHLSRLVISLEAQIVNSSPSDRNNPPASDTIFVGNVQDVGEPLIIVNEQGGQDENGAEPQIHAVWKVPVTLSRPRVRLLNPAIVFSAFAGLKPEVTAELNPRGRGYLQSGLPAGLNLLESFGNDPGLHGVKPRLSALRVSRVAPVTQQQDLIRHLRAQQQLQLTIFAVVHTRIRFSRPNTAPPSSSIVALLEVDFTPHVDCEVLLDKIDLAVSDCVIQNLNDAAAMKLPLSCVSHDHVTFLYHIKPHELDVTPKNPTRELDISISASVQVTPGVCTPRLNMSWTTTLDFTTPVNPGFGPAAGSGIQRSHRPSQLSISGPQSITPLKSPSVTRPDALPALEAATSDTEVKIPDLGITMSFTGPREAVLLGEVFSWTVYVVNRSADNNTRPPRKLALVAIPKRRRNEVRPMRPPSTASRRRGETEIADAFVDENLLHAMHRSSLVDSPDVVCLSADTRIGPLGTGACHVVELQFMALQEGLVGVEAIRIVDLSSQEHVDIRDLPTVMVRAATA